VLFYSVQLNQPHRNMKTNPNCLNTQTNTFHSFSQPEKKSKQHHSPMESSSGDTQFARIYANEHIN
jgi:hypothetical protein